MMNTSTSNFYNSGLERVRARLLSDLHAGRLRPGDRVPSVRRLADLTGMNRKTIHRAYTSLVHDGLLEARPGSGTYITTSTTQRADNFPVLELMQVLSRSREEAVALDVDPGAFVAFLSAGLADGLRGIPVTVAESNDELGAELTKALADQLQVETRQLRIRDLEADPQGAIRGTRVVVTTPQNIERLTRVFAPLGISVFAIEFESPKGTYSRKLLSSSLDNLKATLAMDLALRQVAARRVS